MGLYRSRLIPACKSINRYCLLFWESRLEYRFEAYARLVGFTADFNEIFTAECYLGILLLVDSVKQHAILYIQYYSTFSLYVLLLAIQMSSCLEPVISLRD